MQCWVGLQGRGAARVKSAAEAQTHGNLVAVDGSEGLRIVRARESVEGSVVCLTSGFWGLRAA